MTNIAQKGSYIYRSQVASFDYTAVSKHDGWIFREEKIWKFWPIKISIYKRGYYNIFSTETYSEEDMATSYYYFVDDDKKVYTKGMIRVRLSNGTWQEKRFNSDAELMEVVNDFKTGKSKTIDITNW